MGHDRTTRTRAQHLAAAIGAAALLAATAALVGAPASSAQAGGVDLVALTGDGLTLERFNSADPSAVEEPVEITGLAMDEVLVGIDTRPATGQLFGLGDLGQLYVIDAETGAATASGAVLDPLPLGDAFGVDFNPVPDRLRIVADSGQNLRVDVETGAVMVDQQLKYATGDPNEGTDPLVSAAGYTNSVTGATSTQLHVIDADLGILALQDPPNEGVLTTIGELGVDVSDVNGFDIDAGSATAFAAFTVGGLPVLQPETSTLHTVDLSTGAASEVGVIESATPVLGLAIVPAAQVAEPTTTTTTQAPDTSPTTATPAPGPGILPVTGGSPPVVLALLGALGAVGVATAARRSRQERPAVD